MHSGHVQPPHTHKHFPVRLPWQSVMAVDDCESCTKAVKCLTFSWCIWQTPECLCVNFPWLLVGMAQHIWLAMWALYFIVCFGMSIPCEWKICLPSTLCLCTSVGWIRHEWVTMCICIFTKPNYYKNTLLDGFKTECRLVLQSSLTEWRSHECRQLKMGKRSPYSGTRVVVLSTPKPQWTTAAPLWGSALTPPCHWKANCK